MFTSAQAFSILPPAVAGPSCLSTTSAFRSAVLCDRRAAARFLLWADAGVDCGIRRTFRLCPCENVVFCGLCSRQWSLCRTVSRQRLSKKEKAFLNSFLGKELRNGLKQTATETFLKSDRLILLATLGSAPTFVHFLFEKLRQIFYSEGETEKSRDTQKSKDSRKSESKNPWLAVVGFLNQVGLKFREVLGLESDSPRENPNGKKGPLRNPEAFKEWLKKSWVVLALVFVFLFRFGAGAMPGASTSFPEMSYSRFLNKVEAGEVEKALISSNQIQILLKGDGPPEKRVFVSAPVGFDLELPKTLRAHGVDFGAPLPDSNPWLATVLNLVLPPLIYFGAWALLSRKLGGGGPTGAMSVGKSKARLLSEGDTGVTFEDVAGVDEAKEELLEIVEFLRNPDRYTRLGAKIPRGVLLVGPAGTGKTLLARAVAGEAGVPFFNISASEFVELFVGVGAARVRDLFAQAKKQAPCIVFIDELDALGKTRSDGSQMGGNDEREQTLNQLLTEMDGFEGNKGVIVLAATNRPEVLDPALRRPGRFDRQIVVDRPDKLGRLAILKVHSQKLNLADDVDLSAIAARTTGFAGADLANLMNEGALLAARKGIDQVRMSEVTEAIERVVAGIEKKSRVLNDKEKRVVAYHETGHAIVGALMPSVGRIEKISVVPRGMSALGYTMQVAEEERFLMSEEEVRGRIATFLGGRAAEEVVFGRVTTGASDDIQGATDMAERAVTLYGMSRRLGPVALQKMAQAQYLDGGPGPRRAISSEVSHTVDSEIKYLIDSGHHLALRSLQINRSLLEDIAQLLISKEVLEGDALRSLLDRAVAPEELTHWLRSGELPAGVEMEKGYVDDPNLLALDSLNGNHTPPPPLHSAPSASTSPST